jgi:hypothetical protein
LEIVNPLNIHGKGGSMKSETIITQPPEEVKGKSALDASKLRAYLYFRLSRWCCKKRIFQRVTILVVIKSPNK